MCRPARSVIRSFSALVLAAFLLTGCYESHVRIPDLIPEAAAMLIGARIDGDELVIEVKELGGAISEITRLPALESFRGFTLSPNQEWLVLPSGYGGTLVNLESLETVEITWAADRASCEAVASFASWSWSDSETLLVRCSSSLPYFAGLDGLVRELVLPPRCLV